MTARSRSRASATLSSAGVPASASRHRSSAARPPPGSAVRGGYATTPGVGARALHLGPGPASPEELLRRAEGGLFVQSITGLGSGASPVTGDFSVGADGLMIRDGALAEPVREVTVASTLQRMLKEGWLKAHWGQSSTGRRVRIYQITPAGAKHLEREISGFDRMLEGIRLVLTPEEL